MGISEPEIKTGRQTMSHHGNPHEGCSDLLNNTSGKPLSLQCTTFSVEDSGLTFGRGAPVSSVKYTFSRKTPGEKESEGIDIDKEWMRIDRGDRYIPCRPDQDKGRIVLGEISPHGSPRKEARGTTDQLYREILKHQFVPSVYTDNIHSVHSSGCSILKFSREKKHKQQRKVVVAKTVREKKDNRRWDFHPNRSVYVKGLEDDFYINILDWSSLNCIGVSLSSTVHIWSMGTRDHFELCTREAFDGGSVSSVKFSPSGQKMLIGADNGLVSLFDIEKKTAIDSMHSDSCRVGVGLFVDESVAVCGDMGGMISVRDFRTKDKVDRILVSNHGEICGLNYCSLQGKLASGCNNNIINVWDLRADRPELTLDYHHAAVRALAWSSQEAGVLYSGGGNKDKTLKAYNCKTNSLIKSVKVESQITGIQHSPISDELVTLHGFTENDIEVWDSRDLSSPVARLEGHQNRVLYSALSPEGTHLVTGSGDESLRFWDVFKAPALSSLSALVHDFREIR